MGAICIRHVQILILQIGKRAKSWIFSPPSCSRLDLRKGYGNWQGTCEVSLHPLSDAQLDHYIPDSRPHRRGFWVYRFGRCSSGDFTNSVRHILDTSSDFGVQPCSRELEILMGAQGAGEPGGTPAPISHRIGLSCKLPAACTGEWLQILRCEERISLTLKDLRQNLRCWHLDCDKSGQ